MPATYDKLGVRFLYPENWTLDESEMLEGNNSVSVFSPSGGFWSLIVHPAGLNPQDLVDAAVGAMRQEYDELDAEPRVEMFEDRELVGSEMNFYCLDLTNTAVARSFGTSEATYLLFCQADDREFQRIGPVFEAITRSFVAANDSPAFAIPTNEHSR